eukprot:Plantae.Rhodophyta-Palmaria_palmata.ctg6415.p1 GENE.Plantae.Rhodophyta-Palmaria_palmata.ctg6415~~Plantae.Rhodophyta-Palmaria_palmata.ctg6415.p1  ORF type:complete len:157 (+),score=6.15 Plantae.Rhodophyta-Palmaria_palmata.ctg6415:530-1000(+)
MCFAAAMAVLAAAINWRNLPPMHLIVMRRMMCESLMCHLSRGFAEFLRILLLVPICMESPCLFVADTLNICHGPDYSPTGFTFLPHHLNIRPSRTGIHQYLDKNFTFRVSWYDRSSGARRQRFEQFVPIVLTVLEWCSSSFSLSAGWAKFDYLRLA